MRILLRSQRSKLYYAGDGEWKSEPASAVPFPTSLKAWKIALSRSYEPLELVYFFDNFTEAFSCPIEPHSFSAPQV